MCQQHAVAEIPQDLRNEIAHARLVLDDEHSFAVAPLNIGPFVDGFRHRCVAAVFRQVRS